MKTEIVEAYLKDLHEKLNQKQKMTEKEILDEITQVEMKNSLLILSGGLDTVTLLYYLWERLVPLEVFTVDYGQEAEKEIEQAKFHCNKLGAKHTIMKIDGSCFNGNLAEGKDKTKDGSVVIPNRNSIFLSAGISYALQNGIERIYYGAIDCDPAYCDCKPIYVHYFNMLNMVCDLNQVQIRAPFINMTKREVIDLAIELGIDLTETWTCIQNTEKPCGVCETCTSRKIAENEYKEEIHKKMREINKSLDYYMNK